MKINLSFDEDFIQNYNEDGDIGDFLEVDSIYTEELHETQNNLLLLPKRIEFGKLQKLACRLNRKKEYVLQIRALKEALNH